MKVQVFVKQGTYRNNSVSGMVFELVEQMKTGAKGNFVTVKNGNKFPGFPDEIRVRVNDISDYQVIGNTESRPTDVDGLVAEDACVAPQETDQDRIERIRKRFSILTEMTKAAIEGSIRAVIVSGPPGVGKSYEVEQQIEKVQMMQGLGSKTFRAEVVKGSATALGLYQVLYKHSDRNSIVVFDDCDSILLDDVALNLLKGALDSGKKRRISWLSDSSVLRNEGIPSSFDFKGTVIFITNLKFDKMRSQKLRDHLDALQSRCHYLDLTLDTMRDKICRIKQIAQDSQLFSDYDFGQEQCTEIIEFMDQNQDQLREMSLRMAIKIADLRKSFPDKWQDMARVTCMRAAD
jgi:hypothetical protein